MSFVHPYPEATRWTFSSKRTGYARTVRLALYWEPDGSTMSGDYLPEETDAAQLWRMWVDRHGNRCHQDDPGVYDPWHVPIHWIVTSGDPDSGTPATAPHQTAPHVPLFGKDFLGHFTHPIHAETGELVNWLRLPVRDLGWNEEQVDEGGFIQEATGWKPSPLQPFMDVQQVARAAGVYLPQ
ncbi:hypothetical protein [Streptomyces sp. NPDC007117]|uniref:hypothetical protein n=1 Tax=Streptomyces sp. NPDC007117 TaxID=3154314 RepID=UPI0033D8CBA8